jgi:hypothetical protein
MTPNNLEALYRLGEHEKTLFAKSLQTLLTSTFILRQLDKEKELYRFVLSNFTLFEEYLSFAGWHLRKDEGKGILSCSGPASANISLNLEETLSLLVFRLLYEEKQHEINLHRDTLVKQYEFHEKYKVLTGRMLNKTRMREILHRLKLLKLLLATGDETDPETLIILYPSLAFILDSDTIDEVHQRIQQLTNADTEDAKDLGDEGGQGEQ